MKKLAIIIISLMTAFTGIAPAQAFPVVSIEKPQMTSDVQQVASRKWRKNYRYSNRYNRSNRYSGNRYYGNRRYYGHRRYYRDNNNAGAIIGGLAAGAIIGGALSSARQPRYYGNSHASRCAARYNSYRASDNTFQPYNGRRQQCNL